MIVSLSLLVDENMDALVIFQVLDFDQRSDQFLVAQGTHHVADHVVVYFIGKMRARSLRPK